MSVLVRTPVPVRARAVRGGRWTRISARSSGVSTYLVEGRGNYYVKAAPRWERDDPRFDPVSEAERTVWLVRQGFPAPEVVEVGEESDAMWLVTSAIAGRSAAAPWPAAERRRALDAVADCVRALHALPAADCPFDRRLAVTLRDARRAIASGTVDFDDLDASRRGWTAERLLGELEATLPPPEDDVVVCHGDLCLDNVVIQPGTLDVAGLLDAGRLGVANRWLDLAIAMRNIGEDCAAYGYGPRDADTFLRRYGLDAPDAQRLAYYRLLDDFA